MINLITDAGMSLNALAAVICGVALMSLVMGRTVQHRHLSAQ